MSYQERQKQADAGRYRVQAAERAVGGQQQDAAPGPAAKLRRLVLDAAGSKVTARTKRDETRAVGQMYAYVKALHVLRDAGVWDEGIAPAHGTTEPAEYMAELVRFLDGEDAARQLGFKVTAPAGTPPCQAGDRIEIPRIPHRPMGPARPHRFEQDEEKIGSACRFCGLDECNPVHRGDDTL